MNNHPLIEKVQRYSEKHELLCASQCIVIGLSGGPDSVALLSLLQTLQKQYGYRLIAASLDHQWRAESTSEIAFCQQLAESFSVTFITKKAEEIPLKKNARLTKEELGRVLRRTFFEGIAKEQGAQAIALGHHYNDQQETFFLRMIRGATVAGLAAMKPKNKLYIRPLLTCSKEELIDYLKDQSLRYCIDSSNDDTSFLRNAIRHNIIPAFRECDSRFEESFKKTVSTMQETDAYLDRVAQEQLKHITISHNNSVVLDRDSFFTIDQFLHERLLILWLIEAGVPFVPSTSFFAELLRFMRGSGQQHQLHPAWKITREKNWLSLAKTPPSNAYLNLV